MKDFIGQRISEGDKVAYINSYGTSKELRSGIVSGFTPKFVKIDGYTRKDPAKLVVVSLNRELLELQEEVVARTKQAGNKREIVLG